MAEVPQYVALSPHGSQNISSAAYTPCSRPNIGGGGVARPDPPTVVTQHVQMDRQFVIINSKVMNELLLHCECDPFVSICPVLHAVL